MVPQLVQVDFRESRPPTVPQYHRRLSISGNTWWVEVWRQIEGLPVTRITEYLGTDAYTATAEVKGKLCYSRYHADQLDVEWRHDYFVLPDFVIAEFKRIEDLDFQYLKGMSYV